MTGTDQQNPSKTTHSPLLAGTRPVRPASFAGVSVGRSRQTKGGDDGCGETLSDLLVNG